LALAISSTSPTDANKASITPRTSPTTTSSKERTTGLRPRTAPGGAPASSLGTRASISLRAWAKVIPGRSLATRSTSRRTPSRKAGFGCVDASAVSVINASTPRGYAMSGGITPTIVNGCSPIFSRRPITSREPPYRRCHSA